MSPRDVFTIGNIAKKAHPTSATLNIEQPFELLSMGILGPITPTAPRGLQYVSRFLDEKTNRKEILPLKSKAETAESLLLFTLAVVVTLESPSTIPCKQRQRVHQRSVPGLLLSNRHQAGRVGVSGSHNYGDNLMPADGQQAAKPPLGRADAGCHQPYEPDTIPGAR